MLKYTMVLNSNRSLPIRHIMLLLIALILFQLQLPGKKEKQHFDGPYVRWLNENRLICASIIRQKGENRITKKVLDTAAFPAYVRSLPKAKLAYSLFVPEISASQFKAKRVIAVGDIHGDYRNFRKLLINHGIIDKRLNWRSGQSHLVILGDVMNRGNKVTECLWLIRKIEQQALKAGGRVHLLLGNHETMILQGDQRFIAKKYRKIHRHGYSKHFSRYTEFGRWLRTKHVMIRINDTLFVHGGISPELIDTGMNMDQINRRFRKAMDLDFPYSEPDNRIEALYRILLGRNGPVWYRGYYKETRISEKSFVRILRHFNVRRIVVGHTKQKTITPLYRNKLFAIDVMDYTKPKNDSGEALLIEGGHVYRLSRTGMKEMIISDN